MSTVSLTRGTKFPLVPVLNARGPKTLFVSAIKNWPASTGQVEPNIPLDIFIEVEQSFQAAGGGVINRVRMPLPNVGLRLPIIADRVNVAVEYSAEQALAVPYAQYIISGSIVMGAVPPLVSSHTRRWTVANLPAMYPAAPAPAAALPSFASEFRYSGSAWGELYIQAKTLTGAFWAQIYQFDEISAWHPLPALSDAYYYFVQGLPYNLASADTCIEFR